MDIIRTDKHKASYHQEPDIQMPMRIGSNSEIVAIDVK